MALSYSGLVYVKGGGGGGMKGVVHLQHGFRPRCVSALGMSNLGRSYPCP